MKQSYLYILSNQNNTVLYIGCTTNLIKRIYEHKSKLVDGFTKKYNVHKLVYYEVYNFLEYAFLREKRLKKWNRNWKNELITKSNPEWKDLYSTLL
ncbi:GIY-YIG nuclease family protein [Francisella philomiragia]|nr:GIY-YIG nuclease family protein [Francisella philomiragia]MBK2254359.1 GIY-YIG nuclease family protein [Francisella philomiragia]MBK2272848.1 GIY-YIG nuclease family protein [Francisella philomiragia]MBK2276513.1 GIY-YIG nuclease family protein [Francisella philomiragia]MBK2280634.1 GIY-YIG nuclease family protein [Francisella philomiragia]MBK2281913.1 GIY-YIG nuclease family protein [Francisella philomiragia]